MRIDVPHALIVGLVPMGRWVGWASVQYRVCRLVLGVRGLQLVLVVRGV